MPWDEQKGSFREIMRLPKYLERAGGPDSLATLQQLGFELLKTEPGCYRMRGPRGWVHGRVRGTMWYRVSNADDQTMFYFRDDQRLEPGNGFIALGDPWRRTEKVYIQAPSTVQEGEASS